MEFTIPLSQGEVQSYYMNLLVISEEEIYLHLNSLDKDVVTVELSQSRTVVSLKYSAQFNSVTRIYLQTSFSMQVLTQSDIIYKVPSPNSK